MLGVFSSSMGPITAKDVQRVHDACRAAEDAWRHHGGCNVSDSDLIRARHSVGKCRRELAEQMPLASWLELPTVVYYQVLSVFRWPSSQFGWPWPLAALTMAAFVFAAVLLASAFFSDETPWVFGLATSAFIIAFPLITILILVPKTEVLRNRLAALRIARKQRLQRCATLRQALQKANEAHDHLLRQQQLSRSYEKVRSEFEAVSRGFLNHQNQLYLRDWRGLRGVAFENFVEEVFHALGYAVQTTPATGDQGVDLIATKGNTCLAVQVKGIAKSVGNRAVQEAFTGMAYYGCRSCVVVTNGAFTKGAVAVARRTGCRLIDQRDIPDLIQGRVL